MSRRKRPPLIAEIGRLLVEYPEKDWIALADRLRDGALVQDIASTLERRHSHESRRGQKKRATPTWRERDCPNCAR